MCTLSSGFSNFESMRGLIILSKRSCFFWYKHRFLPYLAALQALKRKKRLEKQLTQIDGTLSTIEFQREALENSHTNTEVLRNMGFAAKAMKAVHENMWVTHTPCPQSWEEPVKLYDNFDRIGSLFNRLNEMLSLRGSFEFTVTNLKKKNWRKKV